MFQRSKRLAGITEAGLAYANQNPEAFKGLIDAAVKKLLDEGLDQEKEIEADQLGDVFAARVEGKRKGKGDRLLFSRLSWR